MQAPEWLSYGQGIRPRDEVFRRIEGPQTHLIVPPKRRDLEAHQTVVQMNLLYKVYTF